MREQAVRKRILWGAVLMVGAAACAAMKNTSVWGVYPIGRGISNGLIFACLLAAVRWSGWQAAGVIGMIVPMQLWGMRLLDGFMVPVDIMTNLVLIAGMHLVLKRSWKYWNAVLFLTAAAFCATNLGSTAAIWLVKRESVARAMLLAWNTTLFSLFSVLGASAICVPFERRRLGDRGTENPEEESL